MNILVITQMYSQPDDVGDNKPTKTVNYFVKEWVKAGNKVFVIHCSSKFPLPMYFIPETIKNKISGSTSKIIPPIASRKAITWNDNGANVFRFPMLKLFPGKAYSKQAMLKQTRRITKCLSEHEFVPDVVIGHFANPSLELVANLAEKYKAKSSIVFHQDCNQNTIEKYRINEQKDKIGAIGVRSMIEAKQVKSLLSLKNDPFICCSGVPNNVVSAAGVECKKHVFLNTIEYIYVGSLIKRKHVDSVIKAFYRKYSTERDRARLTIIGGGAEENSLKQLVKELNAEEMIQFTGRVSRDDVMSWMKKGNIFTLISESEVYGMVYIEAMLQGCIVIASKGEGFDGFIVDGENGFLCEAGNDKRLESIYDYICSLPEEERNRIGQNAIDYAKNFSEEDVARRYLEDVLERQ